MSYRCVICEKVFEEIPDNATPIGRSHPGDGRRFWMIDRQVHDLARIKIKPELAEVAPVEQATVFSKVVKAPAVPAKLP